jgi:hypothetical protein
MEPDLKPQVGDPRGKWTAYPFDPSKFSWPKAIASAIAVVLTLRFLLH